MFLKERIIGLTIFYLFLFLFVLLIFNCKNKKTIKLILIVYTIVLSIIAYLYQPPESSDLFRHFNSLEFYKHLNGSNFLDFLKSSSTPLAIIYLKIISNLNNVHLLPAITSMIFYSIYFWILYNITLKNNSNYKSLAIGILLLMISGKYMFLISGIRNGLAYILIVIGFYNEFFKKKSILTCIPVYVMSILIHPSSFIIILIRLLFFVIQKNDKIVKKIINLVIIIISTILFYKISPNIFSFVYEKGLGYIEGEVYSNYWEQTISLLTMFFVLIYFYINKSYSTFKLISFKKIIIFYSIITCIFVFEHSIFVRFTYFIYLLFIFYFVANNGGDKLLIKKRSYNNFILLIIIILVFFISITRGDITALKF